MFLILLFSVLSLALAIIYWRILKPLPIKRFWRITALWTLACALFLHIGLIVLAQLGVHVASNGTIRWLSYLTLGVISMAVPFVLLKDTVVSIGLGAKRLLSNKPEQPVDGKRRAFLQNSGNAVMLAAVAPTVIFSVNEAFEDPEVKHVQLRMPGLHPDLDGLTIAQVSDLHIGSILDAQWLERVVTQTATLNPDIFVVTGDAVDGRVGSIGNQLQPLQNISPRLGKFFVTGNHEFYSGVEAWVAKMRDLGFTVLNNQNTLVTNKQGRLLMAGVWDYQGGRFGEQYISDPFAAKEDAPEHDLSLLLAHQPRSVFQAQKAGFDIQLCGHTHGGQYFPWNHVIHFFQPYVKGLHQVGDTTLYVNIGTGFWGPPMRLAVPPEITLFRLTGSA